MLVVEVLLADILQFATGSAKQKKICTRVSINVQVNRSRKYSLAG